MTKYNFMENPETGVKIIDRGGERIVLVPEEAVTEMALECGGHPEVFLVQLFRAVVPEFDKIKRLDPAQIKMGEEEIRSVMAQFWAWNAESRAEMNMAWLNSGPSSLDFLVEEKIGPVSGYYRVFYRPEDALDWGGSDGKY